MDNKPLAVYDPFRAQLTELGEHNKTLVFDYASPSGNKEARSHIYKLRQVKSALDKARKAEKESSLEYGRRVDSEAKAIVDQIEGMIEVHQKPLDEIEAREKARVEKHQAVIAQIQQTGAFVPQELEQQAVAIASAISTLEAMDVGDMQEFTEEALRCKDEALRTLRDRHTKRVKYEAEQAELAALRIKAEAQAKKDYEDKIAREAADRAKREAEEKAAREKQEAADKAKREKEATDRKLLEEKLRSERLEREKAEAEQRARDSARETEERLKREADAKAKKESDELAKREADKKHRGAINKAALEAFVKGGMSESQAKKAVELITQKAIPHVTISY